MEDPARALGIIAGGLGVGSQLVRAALKRYEWERPRWVDGLLGFGGLILMNLAGLLLWNTFLQITGLTLPKDSVWPATVSFAVLVAVAVLGSAYISTGGSPFYFFGGSTSSTKSGWQTRPRLGELFESVDFIKNNCPNGAHPKLKIIATKQGRQIAELLVEFFRYCGCEIEVNQDGGSYIFPATESFRGVRLRYRHSNSYSGVSNPICILAETPNTEYFPESDAFDFIQIEIGDGPG
jgi:hypothetical protein